jgi:hypothetical protein
MSPQFFIHCQFQLQDGVAAGEGHGVQQYGKEGEGYYCQFLLHKAVVMNHPEMVYFFL